MAVVDYYGDEQYQLKRDELFSLAESSLCCSHCWFHDSVGGDSFYKLSIRALANLPDAKQIF